MRIPGAHQRMICYQNGSSTCTLFGLKALPYSETNDPQTLKDHAGKKTTPEFNTLIG